MRRSARARWREALAFGIAALGVTAPAASQEEHAAVTLLGAVMSVRASTHGADVEVRYALRLAPGADRVPFAVLSFDGVHVTALEARFDGREATVPVGPEGSIRRGVIEVPPGTEGETELELAYRAPASVTERVAVPVVALAVPPEEAAPGLFRADVRVAGGVPYETFPSGFVEDAGGSYRVDLPVVPALVSFRVAGGGFPLGLPAALTLFAVAVLGVLALAVARAVRRSPG